MKKVILLTIALCINFTVFSQRNDNSDYWNVWQYEAKDGMTQKFMDAAAEKTAKFNGTPETAMSTYRIVTGRNTGTFVRIRGPLKPADFDIDSSAEGKYWQENVDKYVGNSKGLQRWQILNNGSYNFTGGDGTPSKYFEQTFFDVKADRILHFRRFQTRIAKNLEKRNWKGTRGLFRLTSGGNRNLFVLVSPFNTYKQESQPENENSFEDDYNELFGYGSFDEDLSNFDSSLEAWGEMRETLQLVPSMTTGMMK